MPSNYENVRSITRVAGADLSDSQYRFVKVGSDGRVVLSGNGERAVGVTGGKAAENRAIEVAFSGRVLVIAGAAVTAGDKVQSDANGAVITQASTGIVCGEALETASQAGELISVLLDAQGAP